jgi:CDP-glycerol glycerophosphotransferase (TagB/SpsB family)
MMRKFIYSFIDFLFYLKNKKKINKINRILKNNNLKLKKNILFQIDQKGQLQHVLGLINLLLKNNNCNYLYLSSNSDFQFLKKIIDKRIVLIDNRYTKFLKKIDICIKCNFEDIKPKNSISIFIGHGFQGKRNFFPKKYFEDIDHIFLYGPSHFRILKYYMRKVKFNINKIKFWKTGYSNYDDQFNNIYNISEIKKELNIKNNKINILYAPSWESNASLRTNGHEIIKKFSELKIYNFIIKLHPTLLVDKESPSYNFYTGGVNWVKKISSYENKYENIYFYRNLKINPLFKLCKLMITDFSGVALGFMLENKPVIFYNAKKIFDDDLISSGYEKNFANNPLLNNGINYGLSISNISELSFAIKNLLVNKKYYLKKIINLKKDILYNPGRGSEFSYKFLNKIISN